MDKTHMLMLSLSCLALLWSSAAARPEATNSLFHHPKIRVSIWNDIGSSSPVNVHCKSGDDDLGEHVLAADGTPYEFRFQVNFFLSTLFHCRVWSEQYGWIQFDAYRAVRDFFGRCTECRWGVAADGLHGYSQENYPQFPDLNYTWQH